MVLSNELVPYLETLRMSDINYMKSLIRLVTGGTRLTQLYSLNTKLTSADLCLGPISKSMSQIGVKEQPRMSRLALRANISK